MIVLLSVSELIDLVSGRCRTAQESGGEIDVVEQHCSFNRSSIKII